MTEAEDKIVRRLAKQFLRMIGEDEPSPVPRDVRRMVIR